jgi:hypothetical protein
MFKNLSEFLGWPGWLGVGVILTVIGIVIGRRKVVQTKVRDGEKLLSDKITELRSRTKGARIKRLEDWKKDAEHQLADLRTRSDRLDEFAMQILSDHYLVEQGLAFELCRWLRDGNEAEPRQGWNDILRQARRTQPMISRPGILGERP